MRGEAGGGRLAQRGCLGNKRSVVERDSSARGDEERPLSGWGGNSVPRPGMVLPMVSGSSGRCGKGEGLSLGCKFPNPQITLPSISTVLRVPTAALTQTPRASGRVPRPPSGGHYTYDGYCYHEGGMRVSQPRGGAEGRSRTHQTPVVPEHLLPTDCNMTHRDTHGVLVPGEPRLVPRVLWAQSCRH